MPTVPCGVQVRGGLYFGAVRTRARIERHQERQAGPEAQRCHPVFGAGMDAHELVARPLRPLISATYSGSHFFWA